MASGYSAFRMQDAEFATGHWPLATKAVPPGEWFAQIVLPTMRESEKQWPGHGGREKERGKRVAVMLVELLDD
jgi:hypothetical protein